MLIKIVIVLMVISLASGCVEQKIESGAESSVQENQSIGSMNQTSGNQRGGELKVRIREAITSALEKNDTE